MEKIQIVGVGNAIVDLLVKVSEEEFSALGIEKGSMNLVDQDKQLTLLNGLAKDKAELVSGGSLANSLIAFAQLGGKAAMLATVGEDRFGAHYREEATQLGLAMPCTPIKEAVTGTSLIMVTPDAERTMQTALGAAELLDEADVCEDTIASAEWLFIEGYVLSNEPGQRAALKAVEYAKKHEVRIAFTTSAGFIIQFFRPFVDQMIAAADLVFANEEEGAALTGAESSKASAEVLAKQVDHVVVTEGPEGVHIIKTGEYTHCPAVPCEPVDLTGAGDMFAGVYLHDLLAGKSLAECAKNACALCSRVITQVGARLEGTLDYYKAA